MANYICEHCAYRDDCNDHEHMTKNIAGCWDYQWQGKEKKQRKFGEMEIIVGDWDK